MMPLIALSLGAVLAFARAGEAELSCWQRFQRAYEEKHAAYQEALRIEEQLRLQAGEAAKQQADLRTKIAQQKLAAGLLAAEANYLAASEARAPLWARGPGLSELSRAPSGVRRVAEFAPARRAANVEQARRELAESLRTLSEVELRAESSLGRLRIEAERARIHQLMLFGESEQTRKAREHGCEHLRSLSTREMQMR